MAEPDLKQELAFVKARTSELSGDNDRLKRELGAAHDRIEKLEEAEAENKELKAQIKTLAAEATRAQAQLTTANNLANAGSNVSTLAKQLTDALAGLAKA